MAVVSKIRRSVIKQLRFLKKIGLINYARYSLALHGELVPIKIRGQQVFVRRGTPDLAVAISCLIDGEFNSLVKYVDRSFDGFIVDAGGYIGTAALALSELFPSARVISIEPSVANLAVLKKNVVCNTKIQVIYGALVGGDQDSVVLRNRGTGEWGYTAVERPNDNAAATVLHSTPAYSLSRLGLEPDRIGIIKLDIEGGELDLFTNDRSSLRRVRVVVAELHDRIASGCSSAFESFSEGRTVFKERGEKYFSILENRSL
jgi:FkbM family methyltransferase